MIKRIPQVEEFEAAELERRSMHNHDHNLGFHVYGLYTLEDTFSMLSSVLEDHFIQPPKRWRLSEFHDYVQAEAWKINNPNIKLPQDLFPSPIKVCIDGEVDCYFMILGERKDVAKLELEYEGTEMIYQDIERK